MKVKQYNQPKIIRNLDVRDAVFVWEGSECVPAEVSGGTDFSVEVNTNNGTCLTVDEIVGIIWRGGTDVSSS